MKNSNENLESEASSRKVSEQWTPPPIADPNALRTGDMPGDKVSVSADHTTKADAIFPELMRCIRALISADSAEVASSAESVGSAGVAGSATSAESAGSATSAESAGSAKLAGSPTSTKPNLVISVCGGSGVGKSETATLLAHYLEQAGWGNYILSGDNYPLRIPQDNDAERLRLFREAGIRSLLASGQYTRQRQLDMEAYFDSPISAGNSASARSPADAPALESSELNTGLNAEWQSGVQPRLHTWQFDWQRDYVHAGRSALRSYLGTAQEIGFEELNGIIQCFKAGADKCWLRRMGRRAQDIWYDEIDMSAVQILIIEWTHGNNPLLRGVDVPVYLNSTPQQTLNYRMERSRDAAADSAFVSEVLSIEQNMLYDQAERAKIIVMKNADIASYEDWRAQSQREE